MLNMGFIKKNILTLVAQQMTSVSPSFWGDVDCFCAEFLITLFNSKGLLSSSVTLF